MQKIEAQNAALLARDTELQSHLVKVSENFQQITTCFKEEEEQRTLRYPTKLNGFDYTIGFLSELQRFISQHPNRYPDDASQIDLLKSLLCGDPLNFVVRIIQLNIPELQSFSNLTETLQLVSNWPYVRKGLSWIKQGNESPEEFYMSLQRFEPLIEICRKYEHKGPWGSSSSGIWDLSGFFHYGLKPEFQKLTSPDISGDTNLLVIKRAQNAPAGTEIF
ncbi:hypothetical protein DFS34DRAFT_609010 [Phlyctochytrium arcticum]|nr:hypothetical protein DFS34DRAFT_609010 [Phlyctochytrium arcticum]